MSMILLPYAKHLTEVIDYPPYFQVCVNVKHEDGSGCVGVSYSVSLWAEDSLVSLMEGSSPPRMETSPSKPVHMFCVSPDKLTPLLML